MAPAPEKQIVGWKPIADELSRSTGIEVSVDQVRRLARRSDDPLPARPVGRTKRRRWATRPSDLAAWARREFG